MPCLAGRSRLLQGRAEGSSRPAGTGASNWPTHHMLMQHTGAHRRLRDGPVLRHLAMLELAGCTEHTRLDCHRLRARVHVHACAASAHAWLKLVAGGMLEGGGVHETQTHSQCRAMFH